MRQYDRIVYTRIGPGYSFDGKPLPENDGYGVFSYTDGLFRRYNGKESVLKDALQIRNYQQISENTPVSYAYFVSPDGKMKILERTTIRTEDELQAAADEGVSPRGDHTLEAFVGDFADSPAVFLASDPFSAYRKPVSYYYRQTEPVPPEPMVSIDCTSAKEEFGAQVERSLQAAPQSIEETRFCAAWLISQFDLPPEERKVLVISDKEENVRMRIAGITSILPDALASRVSFCTAFDPRRNMFVRADRNTLEYLPGMNQNSPSAISIPRFMIVGLPERAMLNPDPRIVTAETLWNGSGSENVPDPAIVQSALLANLGSNRKQIEYFAAYISDMKEIGIGKMLCRIYDAIDLVTTIDSWSYEKLLCAIELLLPYLCGDSTITKHLLVHLVERRSYETQFIKKDQNNGLSLLVKIAELDKLNGGNGDPVYSIMERVIENALSSARNFTRNDSDNLDVIISSPIGKATLERMQEETISEALDMTCIWNGGYTEKVLALFDKAVNNPKNSDVINHLIYSSLNNNGTFEAFIGYMKDRVLDPIPMTCGANYGSNWYRRLIDVKIEPEKLIEAVRKLHLPNDETVVMDIIRTSADKIDRPAEQLNRIAYLIGKCREDDRLALIKLFDSRISMNMDDLQAAEYLIRAVGNNRNELVNSNILLLIVMLIRSPNRPMTWTDKLCEIERYSDEFPAMKLRSDRGIGSQLFGSMMSGKPCDFAILLRFGSLTGDSGWITACQSQIEQDADKMNGGELLAELCCFLAGYRDEHQLLPEEVVNILDEKTFRMIDQVMMPALNTIFGKINLEKRRKNLMSKASRYGSGAEKIMTELIDDTVNTYRTEHRNPLDGLTGRLKNIFDKKNDH